MTRDEQRKACIEAMKAGYLRYREPKDIGEFFDSFNAAFTAAFDALPSAGVRVVPIGATNEMLNAAYRFQPDMEPYYIGTWDAMSAAGGLTNPPETKL